MPQSRANILFVTGIFPPDIGGPATYVLGVANALAARGHEVHVVTLSENSNSLDQEFSFGVTRLHRGLWKPWRILLTLHNIVQLGRHRDVVFVHGLSLESALANLWLRKPIVEKIVGDWGWELATRRGWATDGFEEFQSKQYGYCIELVKKLRRWWVRRADHVITPSVYLSTWVFRWGVPRERLSVIYNAVESPLEKVPEVHIPWEDSFVIVMVARLVPWKGVREVIELLPDIPPTSLVVVGDGPVRRELENLAERLGVAERVLFTGDVSRAQVWGFLKKADVLIQNSSYEGLPHTLLEAMTVGTPVIATDVGGTSELVESGTTGVLIPTKDREALMAAVRRLWRDERLRERLARNARLHCETHFSFASLVDRTEAVLLSPRTDRAQ